MWTWARTLMVTLICSSGYRRNGARIFIISAITQHSRGGVACGSPPTLLHPESGRV